MDVPSIKWSDATCNSIEITFGPLVEWFKQNPPSKSRRERPVIVMSEGDEVEEETRLSCDTITLTLLNVLHGRR